jgi:hypothetical protein
MKKGRIMKFSSISTIRLSASALILVGTMFFGVYGIAHAQGSSSSGQSGYAKENPADHSDKADPIKGHTGEGYTDKSSTEKGKAGSTKRSGKENPAYHSDKEDPVKGHTGEGYTDKSSTEKGKDGSKRRGPKDQ